MRALQTLNDLQRAHLGLQASDLRREFTLRQNQYNDVKLSLSRWLVKDVTTPTTQIAKENVAQVQFDYPA